MTATDPAIIELAGVAQRADLFTFRVLNPDRSPLGTALKIVGNPAATVQVDTGRATIRTLSNVVILNPPNLDVPRIRIQPVLTLANGSEYPLGVFMFGTDARSLSSAGDSWTPELFDETFLLSQNLDRTESIKAGTSVLAGFTRIAGEILNPNGIPTNYQVQDVITATALTYKVGTSRNDALLALAALLGALPPYFDNYGNYTLKAAASATDAPDHTYTTGTRIFDGTSVLTNSFYKAPNEYIVTGDAVNGSPVRGVYNLPDEAPNSYANTGRVVTAPTHVVSGVTDPALAALIARVDAVLDRTTYATAQFAAAADPRHDVFDTVNFLGDMYAETGWQLELSSGGAHSHSLTRLYQ